MENISEKIKIKAQEVATEVINTTMESVTTRVDLIRAGYFEIGAKWMHEELTRWNDPKDMLPKENEMVLVKRNADSPLPYDLAHHNGKCWIDSWCGIIDLDDKIIGWRPIHE